MRVSSIACDLIRARLKTGLQLCPQAHRLKRHRPQDLPVRGVTRLSQTDPLPRIEQGGERQDERAGGPCRDDHPIRVQAEPVPLAGSDNSTRSQLLA